MLRRAHWVREQRGLAFDVLASADDDEAMRIIGEQEFEDLHTQLFPLLPDDRLDTGNNRLSPNWLAAAARADMLVFATSLKDDTSVVAAKNLDALVTMGRGDLVRNAVCVISHTSAKGNDVGAGVHTREHFEQWVRAVVDIPYDPMLSPGSPPRPAEDQPKTHEACMEMAAWSSTASDGNVEVARPTPRAGAVGNLQGDSPPASLWPLRVAIGYVVSAVLLGSIVFFALLLPGLGTLLLTWLGAATARAWPLAPDLASHCSWPGSHLLLAWLGLHVLAQAHPAPGPA